MCNDCTIREYVPRKLIVQGEYVQEKSVKSEWVLKKCVTCMYVRQNSRIEKLSNNRQSNKTMYRS